MNRSQALSILGIQNPVPGEIQKRYRELMKKHHPDASGDSPASLEKAQQITQAYRFLKSEGFLRKEQRQDWGIRENQEAFTERSILMEENLYGAVMTVDTGIRGKFCWDPDLESFQVFMRSVHAEADRLLDLNGAHITEQQVSRLKIRLFHLLLQEFVDPYTAIRILLPPAAAADKQNVYHVPCDIKPVTGHASALPVAGEYIVSARESSLFVSESGKETSTVTFQENAYYYIVTPMILQGAAHVVFIPASVQSKKSGSRYASGKLIITVNEEKKKDPTGRINEEIRRLLAL